MAGSLVCTRCGRMLGVAVMGRVTGHAPQCPDVVQPPEDTHDRVGWAQGYDDGWDAAREVIGGDLVRLYRQQLGKLLGVAREGFNGAARVDPQIVVDAIEREAERTGLL